MANGNGKWHPLDRARYNGDLGEVCVNLNHDYQRGRIDPQAMKIVGTQYDPHEVKVMSHSPKSPKKAGKNGNWIASVDWMYDAVRKTQDPKEKELRETELAHYLWKNGVVVTDFAPPADLDLSDYPALRPSAVSVVR
jgi:hypothetical protein